MSGQAALRAGRRSLIFTCLILGLLLIGHSGFTYGKAALSQVLLQQAWADTLAGKTQARPWPWADTWPVAKIEAPRLAKSNIVLQQAGGEALAFGPALLHEGAQPGIGAQTLIAAHKNTHFSWVQDLKPGDTLLVQTTTGEQIEYRVTGMEVVRFDTSGIETDSTQNRLALITCYPFDAGFNGPLRYIVWAEPLMFPAPKTAPEHPTS